MYSYCNVVWLVIKFYISIIIKYKTEEILTFFIVWKHFEETQMLLVNISDIRKEEIELKISSAEISALNHFIYKSFSNCNLVFPIMIMAMTYKTTWTVDWAHDRR